MAKKTAKSGLAGALGTAGRKAHDAHKADETTFSGGADLPAGIEGGIAQLADCRFGQFAKGDNEGEWFFMASGIVVSPKEHEGIHIEGLRTQVGPEPLCDTPNRSRTSVDAHLAWVYNELRKLGLDTSGLDFDDLETAVAALKEEAPHFRFRTWKGEPTKEFPNPRVNHDWRGQCDFNGEATAEDIEDATTEVTEEEQATETPAKATKATKATKAEAKAEDTLDSLLEKANAGDEDAQIALGEQAAALGIDAEAIETWDGVVEAINEASEGGASDAEEDTGEYEEEISVQDLGTLADEDDDDAQEKLQALAAEHGIDPDEIETWAEVAEAIVKARTETSAEPAADPTKGEVRLYQPQGSKKPLECEVTAVFKQKKTCNLKNLDTGKVYKSVKWEKLSG